MKLKTLGDRSKRLMAMSVQTHNNICGVIEEVGQFVQALLPEEGEEAFKGITTLKVVECETDRTQDERVGEEIVSMEDEVRHASLSARVAAEKELVEERKKWKYKKGWDLYEPECRVQGIEEARRRRKGTADELTKACERAEKGKVFVCTRPGCGAMRKSESGMDGHNRKEGNIVRKCRKCMKKYRNLTAFQKHMRAHRKKSGRECPVCEKAMQDNSTLKHHMYVHSKTPKIRCVICGLAIYQPGDKKKHFKNAHDNFEPVKGVDFTETAEDEMVYQTAEEYKESTKPVRTG